MALLCNQDGAGGVSQFQIEGLDPVLKKLKALSSDKFRVKAVRSAGTKAMRIVRDAARAKAKTFDDPKSPSNIAKNIVTRNDTKAGKREGGVVIKVGVVGGARPQKGNEDTGHFRYVEFGKEGVPARPFLRPALESNVGKVTDTFVAALDKEIDKIIAKGG
jgi:HK97 gp10 family phage protein